MKISPATPPQTHPPHGLMNAMQRVQAAIDRRAERGHPSDATGHVPGANALARLRAKGGYEPAPVEPVPEPAEPIAPVEPGPVAPVGPGLDLIA